METLTPNYGLRKQDEDEFYSETINSDNMDTIDAELKKSADHIADTGAHVTAEKQAGWDNLKTFQTAGGTGTAITLTGVELVDGFQTTFVILASNSGAATTINTKPLYKPGTTTAPNLTAGKAATVWYNLAGDCFFYKASAEGTATAGDVLAGLTFSNDNDIGINGTLALTGDALVSDVVIGKTFYNTDAKTKLTGTYSNIKSVQRGEFNWASETSVDITISSINENNAISIIDYFPTSYGDRSSTAIQIINSTTIRLTRVSSLASGEIIYWQVVEFNNVKTKQQGIAQNTTGNIENFTISSIDLNKSILFFSMTSHVGSDVGGFNFKNGGKISTPTTISFKALNGNKSYWQVIEFK